MYSLHNPVAFDLTTLQGSANALRVRSLALLAHYALTGHFFNPMPVDNY